MARKTEAPKCTFGKILRSLIERRGVTQQTLAEKAKIRQPSIAWFIQCRKLPSLSAKDGKSALVRLADALGLNVEERKALFIARLVINEHDPTWPPDILRLLPKVNSISPQEAESIFIKGFGGDKLTTWARKRGFLDATVQKIYDFARGKQYAGSIDVATSRRSVLPEIIKRLSLTDLEKAMLARFFFERLLDPAIVEVLTSES